MITPGRYCQLLMIFIIILYVQRLRMVELIMAYNRVGYNKCRLSKIESIKYTIMPITVRPLIGNILLSTGDFEIEIAYIVVRGVVM